MKSLFAAVALVAALCVGCGKSEIPTYDYRNMLWFTAEDDNDNAVNDVLCTFWFYPDETTLEIPFEVNLIGQIGDADREFAVTVIDSLTTATREEYAIKSAVIRAGMQKDTLWVTLKKTPRLDTESVSVAFALTDNENFAPGYWGYHQVRVTFSNQAEHPEWWTEEIAAVYLGPFYEERYLVFYEATGVSDIEGLTPSQLRKLALQFKAYAEEQGYDWADEIPIH